MRKVEGFVFVPNFGNFQPLFGARVKTSRTEGNYDLLIANGFTPYTHERDAINSAREFLEKRSKVNYVDIAKLLLEIAEMPADWRDNVKEMEELEQFRGKTNLVVVAYFRDQIPQREGRYDIIGPYVKGRVNWGYIGGSFFDNGHKTIRRFRETTLTHYQRVLDMRHQAFRQGGASFGTTIARLNLRKLLTIKNKPPFARA